MINFQSNPETVGFAALQASEQRHENFLPPDDYFLKRSFFSSGGVPTKDHPFHSAQCAACSSAAALWPNFLKGQVDQPIRVLLIDDDAHIRKIIAHELHSDRRCNLIGQGGSVREGRKIIAQRRFDVMLVDLNLGDGSGYELIEYMKTEQAEAEAVVVSAMEDEEHALKAFELGATGYLIKNSWFGNFPQAVLQVMNGGASITPGLARRLLQKLEHRHAHRALNCTQQKLAEKLSQRETQVLQMVAAGYTSVEIGTRLTISFQTVNTHIKNTYRKLRVGTRAQAVNSAAQLGLL